MKKHLLVIGIIFLFIGMSFTSISGIQINNQIIRNSGRSDILYVGGSGEGNYTRIQYAVENASSGDTVFVYDDSSPYYENIKIYNSISLIGENNETTTIIHRIKDNIIFINADDVTIKNFRIKGSPYEYSGIEVKSSRNGTFENNNFTRNGNGIRFESSRNFTVENNYFYWNHKSGIRVDWSHYLTIKNNGFDQNKNHGIDCRDCVYYNEIINNDISNTYRDSISLWQCKYQNVSNNNLFDTVHIGSSKYNLIANNEINGDGHDGIRTTYSSDTRFNIIRGNTIYNCEFGIDSAAEDNIFYHNNFLDNGQQVRSPSYTENFWNDSYPSGGNYWDDYTGRDFFWGRNQNIPGSDGIGDTPYTIPSDRVYDYYPLMKPWERTKIYDAEHNLPVKVVFQPAFANDNNISVGKTEQQPRGGTFVKLFGGPDFDFGNCVQQTSDGGYIVTGFTQSFGAGEEDVWLIKTDSNGNMVWDKTFGGTDEDVGFYVQQTSDGGYVVAGVKDDYVGGKGLIWLIKTDSNGNLMWDKTFEELQYHLEGIWVCVQQTSDGGYIVTGGLWLIKTDSNGNLVWSRKLGETCNCVRQTTDGGYIITGMKDYDIWLIKTNSTGNKEWDKTFGGGNNDHGFCVQQTTDGGYIITGKQHYIPEGDCYIWLIKTDSNGNMVWDKTHSYDAVGYFVQQTTDGGYIITGYEWDFFSPNVYLIKTNSAGNEIWDSKFGYGSGSYCVQQTTDEGYILTGWGSGADVLLMKTDEYGRSRNKAVTNPMLLRLLERFPLLWRVVSRLNVR